VIISKTGYITNNGYKSRAETHMNKRKADVILHPTRMRILVAISGRQMTSQQLARALPDIPQTTLYRHISHLVDEHILTVLDEQRVRGTVERLYALAAGASRITPEELAEAAPEDHLRYFSIFVTSLLVDFGRYVQAHEQKQARIDVARDSVVYTKATVFMSDEERQEFQEAAQALLIPLLERHPAVGRRAYLFATTFFPAPEAGEVEEEHGTGQPAPEEQPDDQQ
jgi:DNA-binding transcriptional ArsR family regulator